MKIRATPLELLAVTMLLIMAVLFAGAKCFGQETQQVESAILWTVTPSDDDATDKAYNGTRAQTDTEYRRELATAIISAAEKYSLPTMLLVAIAYRESVYRMGEIGDSGKSLGIMQTGRMARNRCDCDMDTVHGQVHCGACWLDMGRQWCGTLDGGLMAYINGTCTAKNDRAKRAFNVRKRLQNIMEEMNK